jgi:hypothetical protein
MRRIRSERSPKINEKELVMITVMGTIASPLAGANAYRIGQDGRPRLLPGTGGIVLSHRVGDACIGVAGDHIEPGVSIRNETRSIKGDRDGANQALQLLTCIGNLARVMSGRATGAVGVVTGKHGGIDTILIDFPIATMRKLAIGDRIQVYACGVGLRLTEHPAVAVFNSAPRLIQSWGLRAVAQRLSVPITHVIPSAVMGSGLGKSDVGRGDYDVQMFDQTTVNRFGLGTMRFGDIVAIADADHRHGRSFSKGHIAIGCVVHGESSVAGHGPGVATLLTGPSNAFDLRHDLRANLATILNIRTAAASRPKLPIAMRERRWQALMQSSVQQSSSGSPKHARS